MKELFEKYKDENETEEDFFKRFVDPLNKKIRKYSGDNTFIISLQKNLRNSKNYFEKNGKKYKILSYKQYNVALNILDK